MKNSLCLTKKYYTILIRSFISARCRTALVIAHFSLVQRKKKVLKQHANNTTPTQQQNPTVTPQPFMSDGNDEKWHRHTMMNDNKHTTTMSSNNQQQSSARISKNQQESTRINKNQQESTTINNNQQQSTSSIKQQQNSSTTTRTQKLQEWTKIASVTAF
jgi:hypothetical protein